MAANCSKFRCAVYTRKSTEHGLELEFNSLDAQREACEAYIKSQESQGWQLVGKHYDDPAFSGGNLERPGLQELLQDVENGHVDVIVVYKIDRLTRSLADFAKLVELFDEKNVSFVAVTQQFNTTTSMGRLTLNVLLSFAQFERELSSERVRDKIAASRKKGKWTGGSVPLGYDSKDKKLVINEAEAKTVRTIFERYLALESFARLVAELIENGIVTKSRRVKEKISGGIPFTYGPLAYLLKNRTYLGEIGHNGAWFPGEHAPIVDRDIFDQVQALLRSNSIDRGGHRQDNNTLLEGLIFDDQGNRLGPTYSTKRGVRYPYYVSTEILKGRRNQTGDIARVPAFEVETTVLNAVRNAISPNSDGSNLTPSDLIRATVKRVIIQTNQITIELKATTDQAETKFTIPWIKTKPRPSIIIEGTQGAYFTAPNQQLLNALTRAHAWVKLLKDGAYDSIEALAQSANIHPKIVRNGIRIAFLAPDITQAILEGTQPIGLKVKDFNRAIPLDWTEQRRALGFCARDVEAA